jgi:hypothetical protein
MARLLGAFELPDASFPAAELTEALGVAPVAIRRVAVERGHTRNEHWVVELADGGRVFVKQANDETGAGWLRDEHTIYANVRGDFLARMLGWCDEPEATMLVLEDLSDADWPPPWSVEKIRAWSASRSRTQLPMSLQPECRHSRRFRGPFRLGVGCPGSLRLPCPWAMFDRLASRLATSSYSGGPQLRTGGQVARTPRRPQRQHLLSGRPRAPSRLERGLRRESVRRAGQLAAEPRTEGGPDPWELRPKSGNAAALVSGMWADLAWRPPAPRSRADVRALERRQLAVALPWAARMLGLPAPDGTLGS